MIKINYSANPTAPVFWLGGNGLVNMAERVHRIRRGRSYLSSDAPQPGSLSDVVVRLAADGLSSERMRQLLGHNRC